ncbi:MAG: LysM peptidoglycan-binding domain-containing protein [Akkermansia sp.]|nr:LysM peptidoglycan-binding domain-containing protein [Akkermansia sp.]
MTSTFSILSAAVLFSLGIVHASDEGEFSLWPRRPEELEQARKLAETQKLDEAAALLQPYVQEKGIAGREARQIAGSINVRRYLSRSHPRASIYRVKRGDTLARIAASQGCPPDVIMLLNGMIEPSNLKSGQQLVLVPMDLRMEIHPTQREVSVWDGDKLVAAYNIVSVENINGKKNVEAKVIAREGYINSTPLSKRAMTQFLGSERGLQLDNGITLASEMRGAGRVVRMEKKDLNELTLLVGVGGRVSVVCDEDTFEPVTPAE